MKFAQSMSLDRSVRSKYYKQRVVRWIHSQRFALTIVVSTASLWMLKLLLRMTFSSF